MARHQLTALMVTHNMDQALQLGNRLIMMHEGRILMELAGEDKKKATVNDLMAEFGRITDGTGLSDKTLLS